MIRKAYLEAKQRHPGMLLLFRVADFYELFGDDAEDAARLLGLSLTTRTNQETGERISVAGFPHHSLESYLRRLLQAGRRVAICDPVETDRPELKAEKNPSTLF